MRRFVFPVIATLALVCAFSGIWLGGLRNEVDIARTFERLPRLDETPFFRCADSFYWVSYAREMIDTGKLRVRFTRMDNAPYGRPNDGWASLNAWYLVALGKVAIVLSFVQLRWAGIAGASAAAVAAVLFADLGMNRSSVVTRLINVQSAMRLPPISLLHSTCICLSLGMFVRWSVLCNRDDAQQVRAEVVDRLATMEVASVLQADSKDPNPIAIFCGQKERQAWINYVTGIRSVGSLYWDSPSGIRDEAEFLAAYDEEAAHRIARTRGINYVIVAPNGGNVIAYHYMWQGNKSAPQIRQTLAYRLAAPSPSPPGWLQLLPRSTPAIRSEDLRVYRVL